MYLVLYADFAKKINSTKYPSLDYANKKTVSVYMKQDTSIESPVFIVDKTPDNNFNYMEVNYCEFSDHFYFVDDVIIGNNNIIEYQCTIDVLATWKAYIGETEQYIVRSSNASAYAQGASLPDIMYAVKPYNVTGQIVNPTYDEGVTSPLYDIKNGFYVLGFTSEAPTETYPWQTASLVDFRGSVSYMLMSATQMQTFLRHILNLNVTEADLQPKDFISSIVYIPYALNLTGHPVMTYRMEFAGTEFTFDYTSVASISAIDRGIYTVTDTDFDIPSHPDAATRGSRMNLEPYTRILFHGGPYGDVSIPNNIFYNGNDPELIIKQKVDICTGVGTIRFINRYNGNEFQRVNGQVGLNVRISQLYTRSKAQDLSLISSLSSSFAKTVGQLSQKDLYGALATSGAALVEAYAGIYTGELPKVSSAGNNDSLIDFIDSWTIEMLWYKAIDENLPELGRPVYKRLVIRDYPGYIQCSTFTAEIPCHLSEYQRIVEYANTGFYYE